MTLEFKARVINSTQKNELSREIMDSVEKSPELSKELKRVIDNANRRITRLQSASDIISPALQSLGGERFRIGGMTWEQRKAEYARAIAFLRQPTSTLEGAREYTQFITENVPDNMKESVINRVNDESEYITSMFNNVIYETMTEVVRNTVDDVSTQIEKDSIAEADALEENLQIQSDALATSISITLDKSLESIINKFKDF